ILARQPFARLLVAGPGRRPAGLSNVEFLGELTEPDKRARLRDADIVLAPTTHGESFGLVLVEAMAAETTVLASNLPAFRDVLGRGVFGTLFTDDLVEKAVDLLGDQVRRDRLGGGGRGEVGGHAVGGG